MNYKVGLYINDYLTLLELNERIERDFPKLDLMIFSSEAARKDMTEEASEMFVTDLARVKEADILIILSKIDKPIVEITDFDGTIIDMTGYEFAENAEVIRIAEPIRQVIDNFALPAEKLSVQLQLPACVFGKDGVEDLMRQTRDIFTFESHDNIIFEDRIAFNTHFNPKNLASLAVGSTVDEFADNGGDIHIRMAPLSTVFIIDVYAREHFELKSDDGYLVPDGYFTAADLAERDEVFIISNRLGYTVAGDYIRVSVGTVMEKLGEVIG